MWSCPFAPDHLRALAGTAEQTQPGTVGSHSLVRMRTMQATPFLVALAVSLPVAAQEYVIPLDLFGTGYRTVVTFGDVDGDGIADAIVARNGALVWQRGLSGAPERRFDVEDRRIGSVGLTCENAGRAALVDVDADGDIDIVTADTSNATTSTPHAVWFSNDGKGGFARAEPFRTTGGEMLLLAGPTDSVTLIDFDGDSRRDVVVTARQLMVHLAAGEGHSAVATRTGNALRSPVFCDWNRDGALDLVGIADRRVVLLERRAAGFDIVKTLADVDGDAGQAWVDVLDWNGDGSLDLVLSESHPATKARLGSVRVVLTR